MILEFRVRIARPSQHAYFVVFVVFAGRDEAMSCGRRDKCGARGRWEPLRAGGCAGNRVFSLSTMANWDLGFYFTSYDAIASREVKPRLVTWYRHGVSSKSPERAPQDSK